MKPEAINRACAELCGWEFCPSSDVLSSSGISRAIPDSWIDPNGCAHYEDSPLPSFTTSLDAAQMAFKVLPRKQQIEAIRILALDILKLCPLAGDYFMAQEVDVCAIMLATPLQWCEAILKAAGKWKEE